MSEKISCRICLRVERRADFTDIFESRFRLEKCNKDVYLYEAMQQLTGIEVCLLFYVAFGCFIKTFKIYMVGFCCLALL